MECGECNLRSSVGFCHECEMLLCEECSHTCERCHKTVCKSHIQRTSSGRRICVSCVVHHYDKRAKKAKERREMRAEAAVIGEQVHHPKKKKSPSSTSSSAPPPAEGAGFSFEALNDGDAPAYTVPAFDDEGPAPFESPLADVKALNERVLTGSAETRKPAWFSGSVLAVLSIFFCVGSLTGGTLGAQQMIFTILAVIISLGTLVWTGPSSFSKEESKNRTRCRVVFFLGLMTFGFSSLILYIRLFGQ